MRLNDIIHFLRLLGVGEVKVSDDGDWVRCSCVLAPYTHFKGKDENPSFGIKVNDKGESGFHCFTCRSGRLFDLVHIMNFTTGIPKSACDYFGSREVFDETEDDRPLLKKYQDYRDIYEVETVKPSKRIPIPEKILSHYPLLETSTWKAARKEAEDFMVSRGIFPDLLYKYSTRHDPSRRLICFPIHGIDKETYRLHLRVIGEKTFWHLTPEIAGYPDEDFGSNDAMYGMQFYDPTKPLILVESETDVLRLAALGLDEVFSIVGTCGTPNKKKLGPLRSKVVYLGFDADQAGETFYKKCVSILPRDVTLYKLDWSIIEIKSYTPKRRKEKIRKAKDAGDLRALSDFEAVIKNKIPVGMGLELGREYPDLWK